jgi:hypothetical protein
MLVMMGWGNALYLSLLNHNSRKLTSSHSRPRIIILIHQAHREFSLLPSSPYLKLANAFLLPFHHLTSPGACFFPSFHFSLLPMTPEL